MEIFWLWERKRLWRKEHWFCWMKVIELCGVCELWECGAHNNAMRPPPLMMMMIVWTTQTHTCAETTTTTPTVVAATTTAATSCPLWFSSSHNVHWCVWPITSTIYGICRLWCQSPFSFGAAGTYKGISFCQTNGGRNPILPSHIQTTTDQDLYCSLLNQYT